MSAQIQSLFDQLYNVGNQKNLDTRTFTENTGTSFSDFLKDSTKVNAHFFDPGTQLENPEGTQAKELDSYSVDDELERQDFTTNDYEDENYASDDQEKKDRRDHEDRQSPIVNPLTNAVNDASTKISGDGASVAATQKAAATQQHTEQAQQTNAQNQNETIAANSTKQTAVNASTTTISANNASNANNGANANIGNGNIAASVTVTQEATVVAKAQGNLNTNTTLAAQNGANGKQSVADMLLATSDEAAALNTNPAATNKTKNGNGNNSAAAEKSGKNASQINSANTTNAATSAEAQKNVETKTTSNRPETTLAQAAPASINATTKQTQQAPAPLAPLDDILVDGSGSTSRSTDSSFAANLNGQQNNQVQNGNATAKSAQANSSRPNIPPKIISDQVSVNIQRAAAQSQDRINIQLRPQELGRIDVAMELAKDGKMTAVVTAEKQETLDMLREDSSTLLESLMNAGMKADSSSLSFNLGGRENSFDQFAAGNKGKSLPEKEFNLDGEDGTEIESTTSELLGRGEIAQPDADGRYDFQV